MKYARMEYTKMNGERIMVEVDVCKYGDVRGNRPRGADLRPWGEIPEGYEGYELLTSLEGWEEGDCVFLTPKGARFIRTKKGSPHHCGEWECRK